MASISGGTRCRRRNCKYATGTNDRIYYRCNYFQCTLSTRTKAICDLMGLRYDDPQRFEYLKPDKCPVYEKAGGRAKRKNVSLPPPSVKRPRYDWEKARELHGEGFTDEEIAEAIGSAVTTVRNWRLAQDMPVNLDLFYVLPASFELGIYVDNPCFLPVPQNLKSLSLWVVLDGIFIFHRVTSFLKPANHTERATFALWIFRIR